MMRLLISLLCFVALVGCATAGKMSNMQIGMTKDEIIEIMGHPTSISAKDNTEYLNYELYDKSYSVVTGTYSSTPYFVRLINGKVDAFGREGDFDSTQKPTIKIETDETITTKTDSSENNKDKLYSELQKLKSLKEQGLITQEEFNVEKKELLEKY